MLRRDIDIINEPNLTKFRAYNFSKKKRAQKIRLVILRFV